MHARISANVSVVFDDNVAGEGRGIGHDHAVAEYAIVRYVRLGHQQAVVANLRQHSPACGAAMDCHKLSNVISFPNARFGWLAFVLQILGRQSNRNEGKNARVLVNNRAAVNYHMRLEPHAVFQFHFIADN
jgi:hypothetical protein